VKLKSRSGQLESTIMRRPMHTDCSHTAIQVGPIRLMCSINGTTS
jgi:hypothetical protein